jgi:hypothetical protein
VEVYLLFPHVPSWHVEGIALLYLTGGRRFEIETHLALFQLISSYRVSKAVEIVMTNSDFQWTVARRMYKIKFELVLL